MKRRSLLFLFLSGLLGITCSSSAAQKPETVWKDYYGKESPVRVAAFSPDGKYLAAGGKNEIRLYRAQDGKLVRTMKYPINEAKVTHLKFSPDGKMLGALRNSSGFRIWRVSDGQYLQSTEFNVGGDFAFSPDSQFLAFTTKHKEDVRVHRISDGALVKTFPTTNMTGASVAYSPDGRLLAVGDDPGVVRIWRFSDGKLLRTLRWPKESGPGDIAFTPDGKTLAISTLSPNGDMDKQFYLWRVADGQRLHTLRTNWEIVHTAFDLSSDGKTLVTGTGGPFPQRRGQLHLWRVRDGKLLRTLELARPTNSVSLSPDGRLIAYSQNDALIVARNPVGNARSANRSR